MAQFRLLLVEDDPDVAAVIRFGCEEALGAVVSCVFTQPDALKALQHPPFTLAVVDIVLPGGSGFEVAERASASDVPVLLTTGHPTELGHCADHGFPHLSKPFSVAELVDAANRAVKRSRENVEQVKRACAAFLSAMERANELAVRTRRALEVARAQMERRSAMKPGRDASP